MSAEIGTTEAAELVALRAQYIEDMATAEKQGDCRWYLTAQREVRRIESKLAKLERWAAQAA
jgi:hypothetical protein